LVFAPCGSGKSHFVDNSASEVNVVDGDVVLDENGIKNRNYYWYENRKLEQRRIRLCLREKLQEGVHVLYSGNPVVWKPDVIVLPPQEERWERVSTRRGFRPTREQFLREESAYANAKDDVPTLASFTELKDFLNT